MMPSITGKDLIEDNKKSKKFFEDIRKRKIYLLDRDMSWKTFKLLQDKLVDNSGPTPVHGDEMVYELMKEKKIYCWFTGKDRDMMLSPKIPEGEIYLIKDPDKL